MLKIFKRKKKLRKKSYDYDLLSWEVYDAVKSSMGFVPADDYELFEPYLEQIIKSINDSLGRQSMPDIRHPGEATIADLINMVEIAYDNTIHVSAVKKYGPSVNVNTQTMVVHTGMVYACSGMMYTSQFMGLPPVQHVPSYIHPRRDDEDLQEWKEDIDEWKERDRQAQLVHKRQEKATKKKQQSNRHDTRQSSNEYNTRGSDLGGSTE